MFPFPFPCSREAQQDMAVTHRAVLLQQLLDLHAQFYGQLGLGEPGDLGRVEPLPVAPTIA